MGYFTVNPEDGEGIVDWDWLAAQPLLDEPKYVRHFRFCPSRWWSRSTAGNRRGVILKPGAGAD